MTNKNYHPNQRSLWNKIWRDNRGQVVIWQSPNAWLYGWIGFTVGSLLIHGHNADVLSWIAQASLVIWSLLEITKGVNYFRRLLGLVVLAFAIASILKNF